MYIATAPGILKSATLILGFITTVVICTAHFNFVTQFDKDCSTRTADCPQEGMLMEKLFVGISISLLIVSIAILVTGSLVDLKGYRKYIDAAYHLSGCLFLLIGGILLLISNAQMSHFADKMDKSTSPTAALLTSTPSANLTANSTTSAILVVPVHGHSNSSNSSGPSTITPESSTAMGTEVTTDPSAPSTNATSIAPPTSTRNTTTAPTTNSTSPAPVGIPCVPEPLTPYKYGDRVAAGVIGIINSFLYLAVAGVIMWKDIKC